MFLEFIEGHCFELGGDSLVGGLEKGESFFHVGEFFGVVFLDQVEIVMVFHGIDGTVL